MLTAVVEKSKRSANTRIKNSKRLVINRIASFARINCSKEMTLVNAFKLIMNRLAATSSNLDKRGTALLNSLSDMLSSFTTPNETKGNERFLLPNTKI